MEAVPSGQAKIADVAAFAGVGVATVSRVLNGRDNVSQATRDRVLEAIRTLDYRPSALARNLSLKRTMVIGVVTPFLTNPSPIERVRGIVTALGDSPYDLALFDVESASRQERAFRLLADPHRTDGLLIVSLVPPPEEVRRLQGSGIATVLVDARHDTLPSVVVDDVEGGRSRRGTCSSSAIAGSPSSVTSRPMSSGSTRAATARWATGVRWRRRRSRASRLRARGNAEPARRAQHCRGAAPRCRSRRRRSSPRPTPRRSASWRQPGGSACRCPRRCRSSASTTSRSRRTSASRRSASRSSRAAAAGAELLLGALSGSSPPVRVETLSLDLVVRGDNAAARVVRVRA